MLHDFPGTVESSSNLAIVKTSDELIEVKILVRSSSESRRDSVCSSLESVFALAGAKVEESGHYNGWQPSIALIKSSCISSGINVDGNSTISATKSI